MADVPRLLPHRCCEPGYVGDASLNDSQAFFVWIPLELRRRYENTLLAQVDQVAQRGWGGGKGQAARGRGQGGGHHHAWGSSHFLAAMWLGQEMAASDDDAQAVSGQFKAEHFSIHRAVQRRCPCCKVLQPPPLPMCVQAMQEQRANHGVITTSIRGPQRPKVTAVAARDEISKAFKAMVDEVERNHATQVRLACTPSFWPASRHSTRDEREEVRRLRGGLKT